MATKTEKETNEKIKKASMFLQALVECKKTNEAKITYLRKLLFYSGCKLISSPNDSGADESIKKVYYKRGIIGIVKDGFSEGFKFKECCEFLENTINNIDDTYTKLGINIKKNRKDFTLLCQAIAQQLKNFIEIEDEAVYDFVRDLYRDLIINDDNQDTLEARKKYFEALKSSDRKNMRSYLKKLKQYEDVTIFFDRNKARKFYDVFVCNNITYLDEKKNKVSMENISIPKLLNFNNTHLFLEASGGVGKTMMMKHLLLSAIYNFDEHYLLPLFINLRDYQNEDDFEKFALDKINSILEYPISNESFTSLLDNGQCLFLLDGLDEINSEYLYEFDKQITKFGTRFNKNYIIISSRPYQNNDYLNTFKTLNLQPFTITQAKALIEKLNYKPESPEIAINFVTSLDKRLYKTHKEFCENPLLLTIMLMTYDQSGIPENRHEFYDKAYWAMSEKYNPFRGKKHGMLATKLTPSRFLEVLCRFCFETYHDYKFSFTESEIESYIAKIKLMPKFSNETFTFKEFKKDLTDHLCLLYKNGNEYIFIHRSFQEFFCAKYFSTQSPSKYSAIGEFIDKRDESKVREILYKNRYVFFFEEYVYDMFYAMNPSFFEELILLPVLSKYMNLELFNDREEFLYFLTQCYDEIMYDTGVNVDELEMPRLKSNIISKILRDLDDEDNDLPYSPQLIIKCEIPEFHVESYGWVNLPDDEDDDDVNGLGLQMATITPENEAFVDECGAIYSFNPQIIYDKKDEYWELIDELEQSVLYEYFTYIKDFYVKLKDKYKPLTESSLKDTLE